jgi:hypothetical protein
MMQKREFLRFIEDNNFYELFIECGWNNPQGDTDLGGIEEDSIAYHFEQIVERNGFKIVKCAVNVIPNPSLCKKLDHYLRRLANDYVCIFHQPSPWRHMWLVPVNKVDKRDLVRVEYGTLDQASFLYEKVSGFSFEFGTKTNIIDVREKVQKAFLVDSEKITKKFYEEFRKQHKQFTSFITGIDDFIDEENKTRPKNQQVENKNKQWYASIMLNRLMFCYFIQRKRFLDGRTDYLRYKLKEIKEQEGDDQFYSFYRSFLIHLFHEGINTPKHDSPEFLKRYGRIPYLNGGLFGEHELEHKYKDIDISDEAFEKLFVFFDQWNWHLDTSLTASGKDINPDVLGYIFEQYINDRATMGAYYTKEDITEYIGRNTILPFLMDATKKIDERPFKTNGEVWKFLRESGDAYIFNDIKKGKNEEIPEEIGIGIDTTKPNLLERRRHWNGKTPEALALPTEIWRETIERLQRYKTIKEKITNGEITEINDFITYNLDIRQFVQDLLAQTDDHLFVKHFYAQLQKVTILDPTCGSGAFLFAALNILEPLYEVCIDRMQSWNADNPNLFKEELEELNGRYRSNIRYFIYKNIILRNLYGVDIMAEATEIAKLRLFLKMVAVVDVNNREENLGLDPLPDIDFNIRCGNTLVGYATNVDLEKDLIEGDMFANAEFKDKVHTEMDKVAHAYETFKIVQLKQSDNLETYRTAKQELKDRLKNLNSLLNDKQYKSTISHGSLSYDEWLKTHQPFNWLAEYYDIINGNGGFDVIIGNPPYVEYTRKNKETKISVSDIYKIKNYRTETCSNLYAFVIERSILLAKDTNNISFIVPLTIASNNNMQVVRDMICDLGTIYFSHYEIRPAKLFEGVEQRLTIFVIRQGNEKALYSTSIRRWKAEHRALLFKTLYYSPSFNNGSIWRTSSLIESSIYEKFEKHLPVNYYLSSVKNEECKICYRTAGVRYWIIFLNEGFNTESLSNKDNYFKEKDMSYYYMAALNSNLFWWYYSLNFDMFNLKDYMIFAFRLSYSEDEELSKLAKSLEEDMNRNKFELVVNSKTRGVVSSYVYKKKISKPVIDEIDKALAKHYNFTEEELDFIINYDIKYRMGDELNEE